MELAKEGGLEKMVEVSDLLQEGGVQIYCIASKVALEDVKVHCWKSDFIFVFLLVKDKQCF